VTLGVPLSFVYAAYCLGAFGIEYLRSVRPCSLHSARWRSGGAAARRAPRANAEVAAA